MYTVCMFFILLKESFLVTPTISLAQVKGNKAAERVDYEPHSFLVYHVFPMLVRCNHRAYL